VPTRWSLNEAGSAAANLWLIFIDDLHLDFRATGHLKDLFKQITDALVREGDLFAIVSTGPSSIAIDLTRDRGRLTQAVGQITGAALKPSEILQPGGGVERNDDPLRSVAGCQFVESGESVSGWRK